MKKRDCDRQIEKLVRDAQGCREAARRVNEAFFERREALQNEIARLTEELTKARDKVTELRVEISARDELLRVSRAERQAALDQKLYEGTRHAQTQADLKRASEIVSERGKIMSILVEKIRTLETT